MNTSELAQKMLTWETKKNELDALETEISTAVLEIGKTQNVGNVRATYSKGRNQYDYETPGKVATPDIVDLCSTYEQVVDWVGMRPLINPDVIEDFTKTVQSVKWNEVCKRAKIEPLVVKQGTPSVKIKFA